MVYHKLAFLPIALSVSLYASEPIAVLPQGWWNRPDDELRKETLDGTSYLSMKSAMKTAPEMVTDAIEHLKDPELYNRPEWRFMWIYGPSGTGKSTLAKAIAAYTGWDLIIRRPSDFQTEGRGAAAKALDSFIDKIVSSQAETIVVFEEGNGLMDNHEDNRYDAAETCRAFWTKMDGLRGNNKIFLPITANCIQNVPKQIKTRCKMKACKVDQPIDLTARISLALDVMKADGLPPHVSERLLETCLKSFLPHAKEWKCRDYQEYGFDLTRKSTNLWLKLTKLEVEKLRTTHTATQTVTSDQVVQMTRNVIDGFYNQVVDLVTKSFNECIAAEGEWDYKKVTLTQIDREHISQIQQIHNQAVIAQNQETPLVAKVIRELLGWGEPIGKTIARSMTAEQHKVIKDGKMVLADLGK